LAKTQVFGKVETAYHLLAKLWNLCPSTGRRVSREKKDLSRNRRAFDFTVTHKCCPTIQNNLNGAPVSLQQKVCFEEKKEEKGSAKNKI